MSFYRTLLATVAAMAIAAPVFADDSANNQASDTATMQTTETSAATQSTGASEEQTKININTASAKELMKVKGLNASKSRAIVAYRKKHGNFKTIEDLANVKGFKKMSADALQNIESQLTIE